MNETDIFLSKTDLKHIYIDLHVSATFPTMYTSIFHNLGSPLSYHTLIFDLMSSRNMYLYNAYIYTYILFEVSKWCLSP